MELTDAQKRYMELLGKPVADYSNSKGRIFDSQVINAASKRGLSPEEMTQVIAAGPYVQSLANKNVAEANQYLRSKMMPYESAHRNNDLAAFDKLLQTKSEAAFAFTVAQAKENIIAAVKQGYQALAMTEKALFAIAPIPLNPLKSGIRQITPALLATTVAAKLPGMDHAITSAMHFGGHMLSSVSSMVTTNALASLGHNISSNLPTGFGIQTAAGGIGYATTATLGTLAKTGGQVVGQLGVAMTIGNGIVKGGTAIAQSVVEKGVLATLQDASTAISKAQKWAISTKNQIQDKVHFVSTQLQGDRLMSEQNGQNKGKLNVSDGFQFDDNKIDAPPAYPEPYESTQDQQSVDKESVISEEESKIHQKMDELYAEQAESQPSVDFSELPEDNQASLPLPDIAQNVSKENTQYINSLQQELSQKGIDIQRLEIFFDGKQQFKMKDYQIAKSDVSNEAIEMLKLARTDPANLDGEVLIKQGSKVLFHVKDGEVLIDALRMSEQAVTAQVTTPTKALWDKSSDGIRSSGLKQVQEVSEAAFKSGADFAQVSKMNESYNPEYTKMKDQLGPEAVENVIKSAEAKATVAMNPTESQQQTKTISKGI